MNVLKVDDSGIAEVVQWSIYSGENNFTRGGVIAIANDYEAKNPDKRVIAAINGDFCFVGSVENVYETIGSSVYNGRNVRIGPGWGSLNFIDGLSYQSGWLQHSDYSSFPYLALVDEDGDLDKTGVSVLVNQIPNEGEVSVFLSNYAQAIPTSQANVYIGSASLIRRSTDVVGRTLFVEGVIDEVNGDIPSNRVNKFVIVSKSTQVDSLLSQGQAIVIQHEFLGRFANTRTAIGYDFQMLANNVVQPVDTSNQYRHPRTVMGKTNDGGFFLGTIDGRRSDYGMHGVDFVEMTAMVSSIGAKDAFNLDGGGSTTMIFRNDVTSNWDIVNYPSDYTLLQIENGVARMVPNALLIVIPVPQIEVNVSNILQNQLTINVDIVNYNGFSFDDWYVKIDNRFLKVLDSNITVLDLSPHTIYPYEFFYKENEQYISLGVKNSIATAKRIPILHYVAMYYDKTDIMYVVHLEDPDRAIVRSSVQLGSESRLLVNQRASFSGVTESLDNQSILIGYDLNDGQGRINIQVFDFRIRCDALVFMALIKDRIESRLEKVITP